MLEMNLLVKSKKSHANINVSIPTSNAHGGNTCNVGIRGLSRPVDIKSDGSTPYQALHHGLEIVRLNLTHCVEFKNGDLFFVTSGGTEELFTAALLGEARY